MQTLRNKDDAWQACPPGTLVKAARRQKNRRRNRQFAELAVGGILALVIGFVVLPRIYPPQPGMQENHYGGIACSEVQKLMPEFAMQRVPPEIADQIRQHLAECPMCRERMERMQPMRSNAAHSAVSDAWAVATQRRDTWARDLSWFAPTSSPNLVELHGRNSTVD